MAEGDTFRQFEQWLMGAPKREAMLAARIERLEAALVEAQARIDYMVDNPGKSWGLARDNDRAWYLNFTREDLQRKGLLATAVKEGE